MLDSVKLQRRQSEIRQNLADLSAKTEPSEDEIRSMDGLEKEYQTNETRYRAALVAEDTERREAGAELETRKDAQWAELVSGFEVRQIAMALDEGSQLTGKTSEVVQEMRSSGGYQGLPVPLEALETRAGETVAAGTPDPIQTRPIVDRLFANTDATRMGAQFVNIPQGEVEWPIVTSNVTAGWADGELADVAGPTAFETTDKKLAPNNNFGVQMEISRKSMKQSGAALEAAVRRDMNQAIQVGLDATVFRGTGANGQPSGVIAQAAIYGIAETALGAGATWPAFRAAVVRFINANAAGGPGSARLAIRPEVWESLDDALFDPGSGMTEWDRLMKNIPNTVISTNGLETPVGDPGESTALMTVSAGGLAPIWVGLWGGVDVIRDPYTLAGSGQLKLTGILTADVNVPRPAQVEILTGVQ